MHILECYSVTLTEDKFIDLSEKEIMQLCKYEYGVEVTREIFYGISIKHVRYMPINYNTYKCYYFKRKFEVKDNED